VYDVAVVGAGLAGLHAARLLGTRGLRVLLVDRKDSIAAPIHTTGIFVRKTWEDFPIPDEQFGPPIRDVYLYSPSLRRMHLAASRDEFRIGRMDWLYLSMLDHCSRVGVHWLPGGRVVACEPGRLTISRRGRRDRYKVRYVIGADGARSFVAREMGLDRNRELLVGLEEIVETPHRAAALHCFLDPELAPGYIAWVAADGATAHVGVAGYRERFDPSRALAVFRQRVAHLAPGRTIERRGGLIPVNGILRRIANEHALLVGDAAGAVSPLTAGGLDGALRLSSFAADVVAAYLDRGDPEILAAYDGARFQARFLARRWMRHLMNAAHPALIDTAFLLPPLRFIARQVFFNRGSFPDIAGDHFMLARNQSANAG
jgi:flavin-dependent dehydrogenase